MPSPALALLARPLPGQGEVLEGNGTRSMHSPRVGAWVRGRQWSGARAPRLAVAVRQMEGRVDRHPPVGCSAAFPSAKGAWESGSGLTMHRPSALGLCIVRPSSEGGSLHCWAYGFVKGASPLVKPRR